MPAIRRNPAQSDLTLDEQSFDSLLSAAFTIQEHNQRRKDSGQEQATHPQDIVPQDVIPPAEASQEVPTTTPAIVCPHCGSPKPDESTSCGSCGLGEFRPGERLQRNWASMWLKSQAQGLWPERPAAADETARKIGEVAHQNLPEQDPPRLRTEEAVASHALAFPFMEEREHLEEAIEPDHPAHADLITDETCEMTVHPLALSNEEGFHDVEVAVGKQAVENEIVPVALTHRLSELQVRLRFHRADLYLCVAVLVALLALLWPVAASPARAALTPWQRALVTLGIAEAPAPVIHLQGDPSIEVWVDPHTALYYCPGAEPYGKTADGRLSSQHDAQLDRFEPAGRNVCE